MLLCCGPTPQPDRVRLRLDAEYFGFDTNETRGPSAVIGDELRPVVAGVESIPIFEAREVAAGANALELAVVLPDDAVDLPDSSFIVSALQLEDTNVGMVERMQELAGTNWIRLDDSWTLDRDASGGGVLHVAAGALEGRALLQLSVVHTPPRTLQSRTFEVAAGATLELGYGLLDPEYGVPGSSTEFTALLACDNADFGVVHRARIDHVAENANWNDARVGLPKGSRRNNY